MLGVNSLTMTNKSVTINTSTNGYNKQQVFVLTKVLYLHYFNQLHQQASQFLVSLRRKDLFASPCTHTPVPLTVSYSDLFCQQVYPLRRWSRLGSSQMGHKGETNSFSIRIMYDTPWIHSLYLSLSLVFLRRDWCPLLIMLAYQIVPIPQHLSPSLGRQVEAWRASYYRHDLLHLLWHALSPPLLSKPRTN
jgi:hypothetical protein